MKVLFAVNNEKVSEAIIKKYQTMYKEIISWKNVYFFNAIIKELQKDKSYDRIVIGEDLEPYSNNNYEVIDNFLFDKLDSISDEASNSTEGDIPIILIATDRREKGENILIKLFGIGIYNVLLGKDRSIENVCSLIAQPRTKKQAKAYYKIESNEVEYQSIDPDSVSETEIQNIIRHYKKLGKNEEEYIKSFDDIAGQYTDSQLKVIAGFLPLNVRAVLEESSPKYQEIMIGSVKGKIDNKKKQELNSYVSSKPRGLQQTSRIDLIDKQLQKSRLTKPVVIPSSINMQNVKKAYTNVTPEPEEDIIIKHNQFDNASEIEEKLDNSLKTNNNEEIAEQINSIEEQKIEQPKRGRGRPKKKVEEIEEEPKKEKRGRGRPKKVLEEQVETQKEDIQDNDLDLFALGDIPEDNTNAKKDDFGINRDLNQKEQKDDFVLPGLDEEEAPMLPNIGNETPDMQKNTINNNTFLNNSSNNVANNSSSEKPQNNIAANKFINNQENINSNYSNTQQNTNIYNNFNNQNNKLQEINPSYDDSRLSNLLTGDKKIVAFVGTSKNGTSFLVNNLAALLSNKGINTAILDLTQNKNSYYIYTSNEDELRNIAFRCVENLRRGVAEGIKVNKNLTVYTPLPGENQELDDYGNILETLARNYSLVLLDCDFETNVNYFANAQEIYLVQTYDILTIQPLTAFLNDLKYKNILNQGKLRIVINKALKLRKLTEQMIIGGISCYNDPATTYINTLFDKDSVRYVTIPFEIETYARYLERLVDCEILLNGYSKIFLDALNKLGDMVYPLIAGKIKYEPKKNYNDYNRKNSTFNNNMNETLNKMRNNF